jgi:hypothetical protein
MTLNRCTGNRCTGGVVLLGLGSQVLSESLWQPVGLIDKSQLDGFG